MNAKKIMGAVLVALLAAALFVGAGAATSANGQTVFVYEVVGSEFAGTWANGANTITFEEVTGINGNGYAVMGANIVEGTYIKGDDSIIVKYPTAAISGTGSYGNAKYDAIGGTYYKIVGTLSSDLEIKVNTSLVDGIVYIGADGIAHPVANANLNSLDSILNEGTYKLQVFFKLANGGNTNFVVTTPVDYESALGNILLGKDVYTLTVADNANPAITAVADSVIVKNTIDVVITGLPGVTYMITADEFDIANQAAGNDIKTNGVKMPNTGKVTVTLTAKSTDGEATVYVDVGPNQDVSGKTAEVTIDILPGEITAEADKEAYYIGDDVTITGTSTAGTTAYFYIAGTNVNFQPLTLSDNDAEVKNGEFEFPIEGDYFRLYDAGTYTVYVTSATPSSMSVAGLGTYTTVSLVLKQPFISVTEAPSVAVKGTTYKVTGTAEAAENVYAYIFGTNFFKAAKKGSPAVIDDSTGVYKNLTVDVKDNTFTVKAEIPEGTADMAAGQYFMVVQHPMYDTNFNVAPFTSVTDAIITVNTTGPAKATDRVVVDVFGRQKANAAEALCQALDSESVDDMYVKLSFVVAAAQSVINPIPETVVQGEKLTVSGSTNVGAGKIVTVEMLSTAFAAVPKTTVGSASFISLITETDENGNWEVTFDTTGLNVDEYTVTAAVDQLGSATAKVNVVEAAPQQPDTPDTPDVPDTPDTPDTQDAPETPGFGALAALAGLGAVAVLLLRRE